MKFLKNQSLKRYNTFGLEATAKYFIRVTSILDLQNTLKSEIAQSNKLLVLGGGSNMLLTQDFDGLVIHNSIEGIEVISESVETVEVKVGAGEVWHDFVMQAIDNDWGGIENLSLIPGTVGAAPMQNIGAYGAEVKNVFTSLRAVSIATGEIAVFDNEACRFGYRESIFKTSAKNKYIISDVNFRLTKNNHLINTDYGAIQKVLSENGIDQPTIADVSAAVISIRQSKLPDPAKIGNSGSFFKNPTIEKCDYEGLKAEFSNIPGYPVDENHVKVPAGWLIEQCGWKGYRMGDIGVHKNQALVLVNYGQGKGSDLWQLAQDIQKSVQRKFGIALHPEVNVI